MDVRVILKGMIPSPTNPYCRTLAALHLVMCVFASVSTGEAASPSLSVSLLPEGSLLLSWPTNFTRASWQLLSTTNLQSGNWQPVPQNPLLFDNALAILFPFAEPTRYFRLQQTGGGAGGSCKFQANPAVITAGGSSTLTWCPKPDTTYTLTPGPGIVTGDRILVSPTATTVYSLTASNAFGIVTDTAAVIFNPCGWLQVQNWDASLGFVYSHAAAASGYSFNISHSGYIEFHLTLASSTGTDAYYFGFATGGNGNLRDKEVDATGPVVYTTTEVGSGAPVPSVCYISLHLTCNSYDFSCNTLIDVTETSAFSVTTSPDGLGVFSIASRPLPTTDDILDGGRLPAQYPPAGVEYFSPDTDLGKAMFSTGVASDSTGGSAITSWLFIPAP